MKSPSCQESAFCFFWLFRAWKLNSFEEAICTSPHLQGINNFFTTVFLVAGMGHRLLSVGIAMMLQSLNVYSVVAIQVAGRTSVGAV